MHESNFTGKHAALVKHDFWIGFLLLLCVLFWTYRIWTYRIDSSRDDPEWLTGC